MDVMKEIQWDLGRIFLSGLARHESCVEGFRPASHGMRVEMLTHLLRDVLDQCSGITLAT